MTTREGTSLGPYQLLRRIGGGGAGEVYQAEGPADPTASNPSGQVVVKVLSGAASDPAARGIAQQAHAAGQLHQPHIVPLFGIVEEAGALGVVMAYAPGGSLGDTLRGSRDDGTRKLVLPLAGGIVARLLVQVAQALSAAHAAGLVHGDLKPNNVFVRTAPNGRPLAVVGDFGQSVLTSAAASVAGRGASGERATWATNQLLFAAPEQLRGECLPASDQYALAALAYLLLTGQPPAIGDAASLPANILNEPVTPPSHLNPALSPATDAALLRALAKNPAERFPSIELFAQTMDEALAIAVGGAAGGLTQEFAQLAESTPGMARPRATQAPAQSGGGVRVVDRSSSGARLAPPPAVAAPEDAPPGVNRRLAIIASVAMLVVLLACGLTFRAISGGIVLPHITLGAGGNSATPTANVKATATAHSAAQQLQQATSGSPVFGDPLTDNSHHWNTQPKTVYFAADGLHLANASAVSVLTEDMPGSSPPQLSDEVAQVTLTMRQGGSSDLAGLRFFVQPGAAGDENYDCFVITSQGSFEIWQHTNGDWDFIARGYSAAFHTAANASNAIAVVAHGGSGKALLFANGEYLTTVTVGPSVAYPNAPTSGSAGLIVMDTGAEFVFTKYAFYHAQAG
ncbi:MAG: serine/threonine-protein kinase [Ktedonobacterales bacterium]